jgi:DNA polymerase-1
MILLLDTYSLLYRAFHALPPMSTRAGEPTGALYGFSTLLLKLLREQKPDGLAFAIDVGPSARRELFAGYKASRARMPDELRRQRERLGDLISALSVPCHGVPGFEADDVLATLAREIEGDVLIVSGDRDLLQTITERARVLFVGRRGQDHVLYDEAKVRERFGLAPSQLPSFAALTGDSADELPGVPGVGPKTASKWVLAHGDIQGVLANVDALAPARLRDVVRARAEQILLNERLSRLRTDAPLAEPRFGLLTDAAFARLAAVFRQLEFESLIARLENLPR